MSQGISHSQAIVQHCDKNEGNEPRSASDILYHVASIIQMSNTVEDLDLVKWIMEMNDIRTELESSPESRPFLAEIGRQQFNILKSFTHQDWIAHSFIRRCNRLVWYEFRQYVRYHELSQKIQDGIAKLPEDEWRYEVKALYELCVYDADSQIS